MDEVLVVHLNTAKILSEQTKQLIFVCANTNSCLIIFSLFYDVSKVFNLVKSFYSGSKGKSVTY